MCSLQCKSPMYALVSDASLVGVGGREISVLVLCQQLCLFVYECVRVGGRVCQSGRNRNPRDTSQHETRAP